MNYDSIHDFEVAPQKLLEEEAPSPSWHRLNWLCDQLGEYLERWLGFAKMERIPIKAMIGNKLYFVVVAALTSLVITSKG